MTVTLAISSCVIADNAVFGGSEGIVSPADPKIDAAYGGGIYLYAGGSLTLSKKSLVIGNFAPTIDDNIFGM